MHVDKAKNDCFFSLGAVHSQPCVSLTQQKALCYRVVGSEHQEAQQMLFGHTLTLSLSLSHSLSHIITIHDLITAFIMIFTKLASATGNRLLIHTAVLSTFF